jgi:hypothetical protein
VRDRGCRADIKKPLFLGMVFRPLLGSVIRRLNRDNAQIIQHVKKSVNPLVKNLTLEIMGVLRDRSCPPSGVWEQRLTVLLPFF